MIDNKRFVVALIVLAPLLPSVAAAQIGRSCPIDVIPHPGGSSPAQLPDGSSPPIELEADVIEAPGPDKLVLSGDAQIMQGPQSIFGQQLQYDKVEDQVEAAGDVVVHSPRGDRVKASFTTIQLETQIGEARDADFLLADEGRRSREPDTAIVSGRGTAEEIFFEGEGRLRAKNATYSACPIGQDDVVLSAGEITLDKDTGIGRAKNLKLKFKNVPIFYLPAATFPISDERKSGFLFPSFGSGDDLGFVFDLPYYFNISPHRDATLIPRYYQDRGFQLGGEFRYLNKRSEGVLRGEFLPDDDVTGDNRWGYSYDHDHEFGRRRQWEGEIEVQDVSDERYLDDFSNNLDISSSTHLPQRGDLRYRDDILSFQGTVVSYTTLDENIPNESRPYDQLPQLILDAEWDDVSVFDVGADTSLINFDRSDRVRGWRGRVKPFVSLPIEPVYGYLRPRLSGQFIGYNLEDQQPGNSSSPSVFVPIFSIDSKLIFERLGQKTTQTLEPRLFYAYIPDEDQDEFPNFDTGESDFNNFGNLFREERFFGGDRIGDTNQLTAGLTWRLLNAKTGRERLRASIAQLYYFEDRVVTLQPDDAGADDGLTENDSDIFAEIGGDVTESWDLSSAIQWDTDESRTEEFRFDVEYGPPTALNKNFAIGYRFRRDSTEQVDARLKWPLGKRWSFNVVERYSIEDEQNLETTVGLGYEACCWGVRVSAQNRQNRDEESRTVFFVTLEFKGLGRVTSGF